MANGYHGKVLHIYLESMKLEVEQPSEDFYRKYGGGSALGTYYLLKHTPAKVDPLGPENTLTLAVSVLTGAPISGLSRVTATAKSPLTGCIGDSEAGGYFPAEMKFAGFEAFVFHGRASEPVYLWVHEGKAELRPAGHLWGKQTGEVEDILQQELGDNRIEVLQAGIAAENGVRFSGLINKSSRANGRTGMGAVLASKNVKAVAVRGKMRPKIADSGALKELAKWGVQNFPESDIYGMGLHGTDEVLRYQQDDGGLPTRNWSSGAFEGWEAIDGKTMTATILKERESCFACTVRCKRVVEVTEGPYLVDPRFGGPEYETASTFGSYCGVDNLPAVAKANELCNRFGMDTISCGATIAWAMDCFEQGLISVEDTDGLELRFGNAEAMVKMVEKIAHREGFGDVLALGSAAAARKIGRGTEQLVVTAKGQEFPAHMPQVKRSLALIYAVNPFGADHQSHEHDPSYGAYPDRMAVLELTEAPPEGSLGKETVHYAFTTQCLYSAMDSFNACQFVYGPAWQLYGPDQFVEAARAITGWDLTIEEVLKVGERRLNLMRAFNARESIGRAQDVLPAKMFKPLTGGPSDGAVVDEAELNAALDLYYQEAGWDVETGMPTQAKLDALGLDFIRI